MTRVQVTLTAAPGFAAELGNEELLAGVWCLSAIMRGTAEAPVHPYPLLHPDAWRAAVDLSRKTYELVMSALAIWLDRFHGTERGYTYWNQCLGWFVRLHTEIVVERSLLLQDISRSYPEAVFVGLDAGDFERSIDTKNFFEAIRRSDLANLQIMTQIASAMGLPIECRRCAEEFRGQGLSRVFIANDSDRLSELGSSFRAVHRRRIVFYKTMMRRRTGFIMSLMSLGKLQQINGLRAPVQSAYPNESARAELAGVATNSDLAALNLKVLAHNLPTAFLEEWSDRSIALAKDMHYPDIIVTGVGTYWDTDFAIWSADARRNGALLLGVQHGGTYGERALSTFEDHERETSDYYLTWGWTEDDQTVPLPSPLLSGIARRRSPASSGPIIWVGTADSRYVYMLGPRPIGPQFELYFQEQRVFESALCDPVLEQLLFRPYPSDFGWSDQPGLSSWPMRVKKDDFSQSFRQRMANARLIVVDHIGSTTMLEALAADCPVLCFGSPDIFDIRDSALPLYECLAAVGVYHRSATAAAETVNKIADDIPGWWSDPERQKAVRSFQQNFARRDGFYWAWSRFLGKAAPGAVHLPRESR